MARGQCEIMKTQAEILSVIAEFERGDGGTWRYPRFFAEVTADSAVSEVSDTVGGSADTAEASDTVGGSADTAEASDTVGGSADTAKVSDTVVRLGKDDMEHAARVLRMRDGDFAIVCDGGGTDYLAQFCGGGVRLIAKRANMAEPSVALHLFMSALKGDRNEFVVQKAVELGAAAVTPVLTKNCVAVPEPKSRVRKAERYRRIAYEAAKQCGRGIIPCVHEYADFRFAVDSLCAAGRINPEKLAILFYECEGGSLRDLADTLGNAGGRVAELAVFIGSEGGYTAGEVAYAQERGVHVVNLGRRILRADTAPVVALTLLSYLTKNL
ncbi:hypothetical protein FACS1894133_1440 [Clostridia bacterium]|nr:hypothetical protein FACS1894133_1440 [Clostridia bacterium]